jgi:hypothetical protein
MVGNAVPVQMAKIIASTIKKQIKEHEYLAAISSNYIQIALNLHKKARKRLCQEQV